MDPITVAAGDLNADELLAYLNDGRRVVVRVEFLGDAHEVTLRRDGGTYYCDTPTRLHVHESEAEMRECVRERGYCAD